MLHQFSRNELLIGTEGLELLKSIEFEEANNPRWNCRIAYSYYFLDDFKNQLNNLLKFNPEQIAPRIMDLR